MQTRSHFPHRMHFPPSISGNIAAILRLHQSDCCPRAGIHAGTAAIAKITQAKVKHKYLLHYYPLLFLILQNIALHGIFELSNHSCRTSDCNAAAGYIPRYNTASTDDYIIANVYIIQDNRTATNEYIVSNMYPPPGGFYIFPYSGCYLSSRSWYHGWVLIHRLQYWHCPQPNQLRLAW